MNPVRNRPAPRRRSLRGLAIVAVFTLLSGTAQADPPPGYYDGATGLTGAPLQSALHAIIDDHFRIPYTSGSTDTWDVLAIANEDPNVFGNILTVYQNRSIDEDDHSSGTGWNREHTWPSSYGFTDDGGCNYPYSDLHHLMPADWDYNTARGNRVYDFCAGSCDVWPVIGHPSTPNFGTGAGNSGDWQVWPGKRGDVARAIFYMSVRYEGGTHGITLCSEPDLILTNNRSLIVSNTSQNYSPAYMGELNVLLQWHLQDPVDDFERNRNDVIFSFQGNRNPFIDHPEWVCMVFSCPGGDPTPPAAPEGLIPVPGDCSVLVTWSPNGEFDLDGYRVLRSQAGGMATVLHTGLLTGTSYMDDTAENGVSYEYTVVAVDLEGNESAPSTPAIGQANGASPCDATYRPWINEIHYDNVSTDVDEGVEIAGPSGIDLTGYTLVTYEGTGGTVLDTLPLSGTLPDQQGGFGVLYFPAPGLPNTGPIGLALVDDLGEVQEFLAYEGSFTAATGPAASLPATDIGVVESNTTQPGTSMQRVGSGSQGTDFTWLTGIPATEGTANTGQFFACPSGGADCNGNGLDDACEIAVGLAIDANGDGEPDSCGGEVFLRGDANGDGGRDISDAVSALGVLFSGAVGNCFDALDANDDGAFDIADPVFLLAFFFSGGAAPAEPTAACGIDPTPDALGCAVTGNCP